MTPAQLIQFIRKCYPVVSSDSIRTITTVIAKFRHDGGEQINYVDLEKEILKNSRKRQYKKAISVFFRRLWTGDEFDDLLKQSQFKIRKAANESKLDYEIRRKRQELKAMKKIKVMSSPQPAKNYGPTIKIRVKESLPNRKFIPGLGTTESEEDPLHRK